MHIYKIIMKLRKKFLIQAVCPDVYVSVCGLYVHVSYFTVYLYTHIEIWGYLPLLSFTESAPSRKSYLELRVS